MKPITRLPDNAQLQGPGSKARLLLFVLAFCLPLGLASLDQDLGKHARFGGAASAMFAIALVLAPVWLALDWLLRRQRLAIENNALNVTTSFYRRSLPLASLQLDRARVVRLDQEIQFKPRLKTNGTTLPGIKQGWFQLANGSKALVSIRKGEQVLWLPTSEGHDLLLEPNSPTALLEHLRQLASQRPDA